MPSDDHGYRALATSHLDAIIGSGTDAYGPDHNAMWMASLDVRTGRYPEDDSRPALDTGQVYRQITAPRGSPLFTGKRVYRNIDAPRGTSLYWDQPLVVAAYRLGDLTGEGRFASAARAYTSAFLARCVAPTTGVFLWGNHYYYDAFQDVVVSFHGAEDPGPVDMATETGWLHEARPIPPAWDTFWQVDPEATQYSWKLFRYAWTGATRGEHRIVSRVTDVNGQIQATAEEMPPKPSRASANSGSAM